MKVVGLALTFPMAVIVASLAKLVIMARLAVEQAKQIPSAVKLLALPNVVLLLNVVMEVAPCYLPPRAALVTLQNSKNAT